MPAENSASDMASRTIYYFLFVAVIVFSARNPKHFYVFSAFFNLGGDVTKSLFKPRSICCGNGVFLCSYYTEKLINKSLQSIHLTCLDGISHVIILIYEKSENTTITKTKILVRSRFNVKLKRTGGGIGILTLMNKGIEICLFNYPP